jgi:signal transduction histidine kinase
VPFALLYLLDRHGREARLAGSAGLGEPLALGPAVVDVDHDATPWSFREVSRAGRPVDVADLAVRLALPMGAAGLPEPIERAVVLPMARPGQAQVAGFFVAGVSPRQPLDDAYRGFFDLVAGQVATAVANARAYEDERARAEALAELDRAKTTFFSNVSHEFRTPLTLMLGPLEDLLGKSLAPETRAQLEVVGRNGQRLLKLVNTLLDFSRIEAGRARAHYEPTDVAAFTADLAAVFRSSIEKAGLRLVVDCPPLGSPAYLDRDMWEKIVLNLVSNAFKFTFAGEIAVRVARVDDDSSDGWVELTVRDTGVGIPESELPHVFERFHRVEGAQRRTHEGTGIGLALVSELAKLHGGAARVASVEGEGTTFTVAIPMGAAHLPDGRVSSAPPGPAGTGAGSLAPGLFADEAASWLSGTEPDESADSALSGAGERPSPLPGGAARARVLLADDNADMRQYLSRLLGAQFDVDVVGDGVEALEALRARGADLVVSDVMMPRLDGLGLVREVRADERLRQTPVILLSARAGEEARMEGMAAGADDYLTKPFSGRELGARAAAHIELAKVRRSAEAEVKRALESEREARTDAERASQLKDEFLATLSHELRTPLNAIIGWSRLIEDNPGDRGTVTQGIEVIARNARVQTDLIADLLDMSRIISGKIRLEIEAVSLPDVVSAAIDAIRHAAEAKGVRIQAVVSSIADPVRGDPSRLQQVLWNLLSNAVKFTPKGGRVQVALARKNSQVEILVSDTGVGIKSEFLPHIFDRFRQADASTARRYGGLGLGLSIVKHLVELHGGTVRAESPGEGQGASFSVELPLAVVHARGADSTGNVELKLDSDDFELAGVRVLAIDDQPDARELLRRVLEERGADVVTAGSADEGLEALALHRPHVILCDIGMPGRDGYDLIREARRRGDQTPAVAVTAFARAEDRLRALRAGFQGHVVKPVEPAELVATVAVFARSARGDS